MTELDALNVMPPAGRIASRLREEIRAGRYALGDRLEPERDMAKRFAVSRGTLRLALDLLEHERLIVRQQGRGTFVASPRYASLPAGRASLIGAMVYERQYYFEAVIQGAATQAARRGYTLATGSNGSPEEEAEHLDAFLRNGVLGVLITPRGQTSRRTCELLAERGIAVVLLDTLVPGYREDYAMVDNAAGTALAVEHLVERGHRRIAYIGHNATQDIPCRSERRRGYVESCQGLNLPVRPEWVIEAAESDHGDQVRSVLRGKDRPTAFVAYNDPWAIRVVQAARQLGLSVPADLSVTGFDDSAMAADYDVPLTSVNPEQRENGMVAVDLLVDKIQSPASRPQRGVLICPHLTIRRSTSIPPSEEDL